MIKRRWKILVEIPRVKPETIRRVVVGVQRAGHQQN